MAEKKKILYIVEAMGGGVFTYIVDLANELVNKYDMYIAYAVRKQTPKNYKDYFNKRVHLIEVKNFGRAINPTKDIAAFFEVKKIAAEVRPDVIHLHSSKAGAIGRIAFDGKVPMFYTPHGYSFLMENCKPMKRRMFKLIESVCAKRNCTTISCSMGEHQETLKLTKHAAYVNNGINMAELQEIIDRTKKVQHPFTVYRWTVSMDNFEKQENMWEMIALDAKRIRKCYRYLEKNNAELIIKDIYERYNIQRDKVHKECIELLVWMKKHNMGIMDEVVSKLRYCEKELDGN